MKKKLWRLQLIVILLVGGNCFGSQDILPEVSLTHALHDAYLSKDALICFGAAADDETRDSFRQTCKLLHEELSIKFFKKLLHLPRLNSLKLGYFACDAAWEKDSELLKNIMRHLQPIHQHYMPGYLFAKKFACIMDLGHIIKIRMPDKYDNIGKLARDYGYNYFDSPVSLYDKTKYACYRLAHYGRGARKLNGFLEAYPSIYRKYYEKDSHLESLLNFLYVAIEKDSALCAHTILPYIQELIHTKEWQERYAIYKRLLKITMLQKKDRVFELLVASTDNFCFFNNDHFYSRENIIGFTLHIRRTLLNGLIECINENQIPDEDKKKYINICRAYGWKTYKEIKQAEKECYLF